MAVADRVIHSMERRGKCLLAGGSTRGGEDPKCGEREGKEARQAGLKKPKQKSSWKRRVERRQQRKAEEVGEQVRERILSIPWCVIAAKRLGVFIYPCC